MATRFSGRRFQPPESESAPRRAVFLFRVAARDRNCDLGEFSHNEPRPATPGRGFLVCMMPPAPVPMRFLGGTELAQEQLSDVQGDCQGEQAGPQAQGGRDGSIAGVENQLR